MLSQVCGYIRNYFCYKKYFGTFTIKDGIITSNTTTFYPALQEGQYIRIIGSIFNDGIYQYKASGIEGLTNETFQNGAIWGLAIPKDFLNLVAEISAWNEKNGQATSPAMSPFVSESFDGYSYSKGGASTSNKQIVITWQDAFSSKLSQWRKI